MVTFRSASTRMVDSARAMAFCIDQAGGDQDCRLVIFHAGMGHDFLALSAEARRLCPKARVLGASGCGVVTRQGVSETLKDLAVMLLGGEHFAAVSADRVNGGNAYAQAVKMATRLAQAQPGIRQVQLMASGIDIANDELLRGFEEVFGQEVVVFGATASDNMRGVISLQSDDELIMEHGAWAVGYADPDLELETQASHGFRAMGKPLEVTRAEGTRILEFNGRPAWLEYTSRLGLDPTRTHCADTIPIGALAEALPPELSAEYGNPHLLRVVTRRDEDGAMHYPTLIEEGTLLWLTVRDEERVFGDLRRMMDQLTARISNRRVVAVFHADCLARGRYLLNRIMKEELISAMQEPLRQSGEIPPWLGLYGFGEFARLGGRNAYHNYTTALACFTRRA